MEDYYSPKWKNADDSIKQVDQKPYSRPKTQDSQSNARHDTTLKWAFGALTKKYTPETQKYPRISEEEFQNLKNKLMRQKNLINRLDAETLMQRLAKQSSARVKQERKILQQLNHREMQVNQRQTLEDSNRLREERCNVLYQKLKDIEKNLKNMNEMRNLEPNELIKLNIQKKHETMRLQKVERELLRELKFSRNSHLARVDALEKYYEVCNLSKSLGKSP